VNGFKQVKALNKGKIYISFALTEAGYTNVKVGLFEAASCGCCVLVEDFKEVHNYFVKDDEIVMFNNTEDAIGLIKKLLMDSSRISEIARNCRERVIKDHTWVSRWSLIFNNIKGYDKSED
jgi:spore maturation protein CgeB